MASNSLTDLQRERALTVLAEITTPTSVGEFLRREDHSDGAYTLHFACGLAGYAGWEWTVSFAELKKGEPSVLEAELTPTADALIAPEWVPWSQRLAEYLEAQKQAGIDEEAALAQVKAEIEAESGVDPFDEDDDDAESDDEDDEDDDDAEIDHETEGYDGDSASYPEL